MPDPSQELDAILAQFLQAIESNQDSISREELIAKHPKFAEALRAFFANQDVLQPATVQFSSTKGLEATSIKEEAQGSILGGRYKLIERIGEGGMGTVWVAEQTQPIRRKVAIKLVKAGMDTKQVLARFEAERQALAVMDHPNIAKVFDGGVTDSGRPYFVMEYVKGIPFTEYCDKAKLSLKDRLLLFIPVCQAVQHAHHKGIVHRDLKPSNLLICLYDGKPVPKVIDFGLAKAMHQPLTDKSIYTRHGMMVGTPLYMSPEQAELNNLDVDTRSDVYSLGVVLYELLTGTTPLERQQLHAAAYNEILRLIKEVEPPRPSIKLSGSDSLPSVAAQRSIDPRELRRTLAGDLDWIVMKALEKERSRRYETANGLARDIERFLNEEAVEACPPSSTYRLKKVLRKHRGKVFAAGLFAASLLLGIIGTSMGFWQAKKLQRRSEQSEADALAALGLVTKERDEKEIQRRLADEAKNAEAKQRALSEAEKNRAEILAYRSGIQAAYSAVENGELSVAQTILQELPDKLRGWEWKYLMAEADCSLGIVTIPEDSKVIARGKCGELALLQSISEPTSPLTLLDSVNGQIRSTISLPPHERIIQAAVSGDQKWIALIIRERTDSEKGGIFTLLILHSSTSEIAWRVESNHVDNDYVFSDYALQLSEDGTRVVVGVFTGEAVKNPESEYGNPSSERQVFAFSRGNMNPTRIPAVSGYLSDDGWFYQDVYDRCFSLQAAEPEVIEGISEKTRFSTRTYWNSTTSSRYRVFREANSNLVISMTYDKEAPDLSQREYEEGLVLQLRNHTLLAGVVDRDVHVMTQLGRIPVELKEFWLDEKNQQLFSYSDRQIYRFALPNFKSLSLLSEITATSQIIDDDYLVQEKSKFEENAIASTIRRKSDLGLAAVVPIARKHLYSKLTRSFTQVNNEVTQVNIGVSNSKLVAIGDVSGNPVQLDGAVMSDDHTTLLLGLRSGNSRSNYAHPEELCSLDSSTFDKVWSSSTELNESMGRNFGTLLTFCDKQILGFKDHGLYRISTENQQSELLLPNLKVSLACVSSDGVSLAILSGDTISIRSIPVLSERIAFRTSITRPRELHWIDRNSRILVLSNTTASVINANTGEHYITIPIPEFADFVRSDSGEFNILAGQRFTTVKFSELWNRIVQTAATEMTEAELEKSHRYIQNLLSAHQFSPFESSSEELEAMERKIWDVSSFDAAFECQWETLMNSVLRDDKTTALEKYHALRLIRESIDEVKFLVWSSDFDQQVMLDEISHQTVDSERYKYPDLFASLVRQMRRLDLGLQWELKRIWFSGSTVEKENAVQLLQRKIRQEPSAMNYSLIGCLQYQLEDYQASLESVNRSGELLESRKDADLPAANEIAFKNKLITAMASYHLGNRERAKLMLDDFTTERIEQMDSWSRFIHQKARSLVFNLSD